MKTQHHIALALCTLAGSLLSGATAHAQALFLEKGESGLSAGTGVVSNSDVSGISVGASYSHRALIDVGATVSRYSYDDAGWNSLGATGLGAHVNVNLELLGATISYERLYFSANSPFLAAVDLSGWDGFVGGFAHLPLQLNRVFGAVPQITAGIQHNSVSMEATTFYLTHVSASNGWTSPVLRFDGNATARDGAGRLWAFDPMIALDKDHVTLGLFIGGVFR